MNCKTGLHLCNEIIYHFIFIRCRLLIVLVAVSLTTAIVLAQPSQETDFQNYQIGLNPFVSGSKGSVYLIFEGDLYRNMTDVADDWDKIAEGVIAVAADPHDDNILYSINKKFHIIKSLDYGKTWISLNSAPSNSKPGFLYINPNNSNEVFAGTEMGLIKTSDAGFTWQFTSLKGRISQLIINQRFPSHYYAVVDGTIYISSDNGETWKKSESGLPTEIVRGKGRTASKIPAMCSTLIFVNWDRPFLLAATIGKGVFRSDNEGASWKNSNVGISPEELINEAYISSQEIVLLALNSIYSSTDGTVWKNVQIKSSIQYPNGMRGVIGYPKHEGFLLLFHFKIDSEDVLRIGYLDPKGVLIGLNYGVLSHSEIDNVWVSSMNGHAVIFAVTANLNLLDQAQQYTRPTFISVSQDGGYSWELVGNTECGEQALVRGGLPMDMWIYGNAGCVRTTNDGGLNWTNAPGVESRWSNVSMSKICLDSKNRNVWYYCVGRELYRYQFDQSTNQGHSVDLKVTANDVVVADDNNKQLFTDNGQLSTDGGWTWTDKSTVLTKYVTSGESLWNCEIYLLSFRNGEIRAVVCKGDRMSANGVVSIIKSRDLGSTWQESSTLPNEKMIHTGGYANVQLGGWVYDHLAVFSNPNNPSNFFIGTVSCSKVNYSYNATASKVFETQDAGETWHQIYAHDVVQNNGSQDIEKIRGVSQMATGAGRALFVGGSCGLWKSEDEGKTWKRVGGMQ